MELENALEATKKEALSGGFGPREKKDPAEWIARAPHRAELHGHRMPITRVLFHPQYNIVVTSSEDSQIKVFTIVKKNKNGKLKVRFLRTKKVFISQKMRKFKD